MDGTPNPCDLLGITSDAQAEHTRPLAFNQGFYNLFLAVVTAVGVVLVLGGARSASLAPRGRDRARCSRRALVLVLRDLSEARTAALQGNLRAITLVALLVSTLGQG